MTLEPEEQEAPAFAQDSASLMDVLRKKHQELVDANEVVLDLPGYEGVMAAKYRALDFQKDIDPIGSLVQKQTKDAGEQAVFGACDIISKACVELLVYDGEGERVTIAEINKLQVPVRYDA